MHADNQSNSPGSFWDIPNIAQPPSKIPKLPVNSLNSWRGFPQLLNKTPILPNLHLSRKRNPGSIRYILAGTLGSAPFDFLKRPAPKYDVYKYAGLIYFMTL